jgi:hypothetical protein
VKPDDKDPRIPPELGQRQRGDPVPHEFNVLALIKGQERYVYVYDDASRPGLMDAFRDQAADPGLSFTWFDATVLTEKAREQAATAGQTRTPCRSRI